MLGFKQWEQAIASRQYQNPPEQAGGKYRNQDVSGITKKVGETC